ncbi:MAG: hypothetical protein ACTSQ9_05740 [Candidatus Hodarchaeales archaeon]
MKTLNLSNISLSILEIISEQRNVHCLVIKGQIQELNKITGRSVEDSEIEREIEHLEQTGLIKQLTTPNTFTITEEGTNYL